MDASHDFRDSAAGGTRLHGDAPWLEQIDNETIQSIGSVSVVEKMISSASCSFFERGGCLTHKVGCIAHRDSGASWQS